MARVIENVIYSVGALAELLGVPDYSIRRSADRLIGRGLLPDKRVGGWRWFTPSEVPMIVEALQAMGQLPPDFVAPPTGIVDEVSATMERAANIRGTKLEVNGHEPPQ
jgi:hypothetical protein